jgi:hypothetical protein
MANLITSAQFRLRQNITGTTDDVVIDAVVGEASRMIESLCGRRFDSDAAATARVYHPINNCRVSIDDCYEITAVDTDTGDDGTYSTSWTSDDYQALPLNTVGPNQRSGWPYTHIEAIESLRFPSHRRASVQVTAKWGWTAVPGDVVGACYLLANRLYEERKAPFGTVGNADFGALPIRDQRTVNRMLAPYMRREPVVA